MGIRSFIRRITSRKTKATSTPTTQTSSVFQGPTRPSTDVSTFRSTGVSTPTSSTPSSSGSSSGSSSRSSSGSSGGSSTPAQVQGPIQPGTDEQTFRETGKVVPKKRLIPTPVKRIPTRRKQKIIPVSLKPVKRKALAIIPKPKKKTTTERIITPLSKRQKRLIELEKKRKTKKGEKKPTIKISLKSEIEALKSFARNVEILGLTTGKVIIQNLKSFKQAPEDVTDIVKEIKKNPSLIKKFAKDLPNVLKEEGKAGVEIFKTSPTEAVAVVGSNLLFFAGTGKALKLIGKIGKGSSKIIKKSLGKKKGTKLKFVGTQSQKGNKITTKVVFKIGKKEVGGAVGVSKIKKGKVLTQTVGIIGKGKIKKVKGKTRVKKFKKRRVFAGRQISVSKRKTLRVGKQVGKISVIRNVKAIAQLGLGKVATAKGEKLVSTIIKFPTGRLKKKRVKSLQINTFVSISGILTKKDLSLIVGKTLTKKKDVIDFVGLIKGTSGKTVDSFSSQKQRLFRQAINDVAGTISATTTKSKKIIPKLSPKSKKVILKRVSGKIVKGKVLVGAKILQRAKLRKRIKLKSKVKSRIKEIQKTKLKSKLKPLQKQKNILLQKSRLSTKQKAKLLTLKKQINVSKQRGVFVPKVSVVNLKFPGGLLQRKKRKRIVKKRRKRKQGYNVFARPVKRRKGQKKPKLIKINKVPLSRKKAKDLRNFVLDTSLARTGKIKKTKGKPKNPRLKVSKGFSKRTSKKFRGFKIVKGKRKQLVKGKVIEKKRHLLDTGGEKRNIGLRRRLKQLEKTSRRKPRKRIKRRSSKRKVVKKKPTRRKAIKRKPTRRKTRKKKKR